MKTVNPLHILVLLIVLLVFILFKLNEAKDELLQSKETYLETLTIVTGLNTLSKYYLDKEHVKRSLGMILKQGSLKSAKIQQSIKGSTVTLSSQSMDRKALNFLLSKVLNSPYTIHTLQIKKLSDVKASFIMEIKW